MAPNEPIPLDDEELLAELREAITRVDPVPADLVDRARRAFGWDAALIVLTEVEGTPVPQPALRSSDEPVSLRFVLHEVDVAVELEAGPDETTTVVGRVQPAPRRIAAIDSAGTTVEIEVDDRGRFDLVTRAAAVVLDIEFPDGYKVRTPSFDLADSLM